MKFFTYILYSVYAIIIIGMGLLFFAPTIPGVGAVDVKIVKSGSMEPSIMTGGVVLVAETGQYAKGDVITFASSDSNIPTTHRIVGTEMVGNEEMFVTKGDANEERDAELVAKSDILGKVAFSVPFAGFVLDFARQPLGFALLVGVPALLIVVDEITNIWREVRRMRRSKLGVNTVAPLVIAPYRPRTDDNNETEKEKNATRSKYLESQTVSRQQLVRSMDIRPVSKNESAIVVEKAVKEKTETLAPRTYFDIKPKFTAAALVLAIVGIGTNLPWIGSTVSFSADFESSVGNKLTADTLDFVVSPATSSIGFVGGIVEGSGEIVVQITPSLETDSSLVYDVSAEYVSGNNAVCENVVLEAGSPLPYDGNLLVLAKEEIELITPWNLSFSLAENLIFPVDNTCVADIVFEGLVETSDDTGGYVDVETLRVTFTAEVFSPANNLNATTNFSLDVSEENTEIEEVEVVEEEDEVLDEEQNNEAVENEVEVADEKRVVEAATEDENSNTEEESNEDEVEGGVTKTDENPTLEEVTEEKEEKKVAEEAQENADEEVEVVENVAEKEEVEEEKSDAETEVIE